MDNIYKHVKDSWESHICLKRTIIACTQPRVIRLRWKHTPMDIHGSYNGKFFGLVKSCCIKFICILKNLTKIRWETKIYISIFPTLE
jgi:hypothetical protein